MRTPLATVTLATVAALAALASLASTDGSTGARRWRQVFPFEEPVRIAADGDSFVLTFAGRIERRDRDGQLLATTPLSGPLFEYRTGDFTDESPFTLGRFVVAPDGTLIGTAGAPRYLRGSGPDDGAPRFELGGHRARRDPVARRAARTRWRPPVGRVFRHHRPRRRPTRA